MEEMTLADGGIRNFIYEIRGMKVMLDRDLARMYEVETKYLNKQVKRNIERFPEDFMFQMNWNEWESLKFQIGTSNDSSRCQIGTLNDEEDDLRFKNGTSKRGSNLKYLPYVFTEQGVAMLSGVLRSERAVRVNIQIMRAFVAVRQALPRLATREDIDDLRSRIQALEGSVTTLAADNLDLHAEIGGIYHALDLLQQQPADPIPPVGYQATLDRENNKKE